VGIQHCYKFAVVGSNRGHYTLGHRPFALLPRSTLLCVFLHSSLALSNCVLYLSTEEYSLGYMSTFNQHLSLQKEIEKASDNDQFAETRSSPPGLRSSPRLFPILGSPRTLVWPHQRSWGYMQHHLMRVLLSKKDCLRPSKVSLSTHDNGRQLHNS
jgi:hypothetical protein